VTADVDRVDARLGVGPAGADVPDELREQGVRVVRLQPEDDELGVAEYLHQADGVQERRLVVANARSVPAVLPHNLGDLLFHAHLAGRTTQLRSRAALADERTRGAVGVGPVCCGARFGLAHSLKANINLSLNELPFLGGAQLAQQIVKSLGVSLREVEQSQEVERFALAEVSAVMQATRDA